MRASRWGRGQPTVGTHFSLARGRISARRPVGMSDHRSVWSDLLAAICT